MIEWIQALDEEELISELYYFKQRHKKVTPTEKTELNRWLSELEYEPQLEALRSIIASTPTPDVIWNELPPEAQDNLRTEVEKTDLQYTPAKFRVWFGHYGSCLKMYELQRLSKNLFSCIKWSGDERAARRCYFT